MTSPMNPPLPAPPCRLVLNNSVKSNMTYSHKAVLLSVSRLYFFASFQDCASGSTLRCTTKMPDKGTIQRFKVNSSHLSLQLLNLKAGGKKESVKSAAAIVLISFFRIIFFLRHQVDFFFLPPHFWHTIPSWNVPIPVSVCFAFWARKRIIFHFNSMISQRWLSAAPNVIFTLWPICPTSADRIIAGPTELKCWQNNSSRWLTAVE